MEINETAVSQQPFQHIELDDIVKFNSVLRTVFAHSEEFKTAKKVSDLSEEVSSCIKKKLPEKLTHALGKAADNYTIKGSVGAGRATKTPWVAIMNKDITTTTRKGVYIVFLFSSDYKHVYITLNQGTTVTGAAFGTKIKPKVLLVEADKIRKSLNEEQTDVNLNDEVDVKDKGYKAATIYGTLWDSENPENGKKILETYLKIYKDYKAMITGEYVKPGGSGTGTGEPPQTYPQNSFDMKGVIEAIGLTKLIYEPKLIKRFAFSLMTKPFVILSGLAGSGKTQLAIAFAYAMTEDDKSQICVVPVGADWTNREPLLGFPNALQSGKYEKPENGVLDLLIAANKNPDKPYFLILDEMNMSYVERYFADFLSSMESHKEIPLWNDGDGSDVPKNIGLPKNLYIIGTINVDETTYMFSPKVLDRANVIEFKISYDEMEGFLSKIQDVKTEAAKGGAKEMAADFVKLSSNKEVSPSPETKDILLNFFKELKTVNAEFGYRSATEIYRFINLAGKYDNTEKKLSHDDIIDCAIVQKLLPKLHGSRRRLDPVLNALWKECFTDEQDKLKPISEEQVGKSRYPLTADKIARMSNAAAVNGFTSFAEA